MTVARGAALGALLLVVAVVAIVLLGGGGGQQYRLVFQTAGQLVRGNDVQVGGRRVGNVDDITLTDDNLAEVTITVEEPYAPLHEGTTATIRLASLSSVANRYIALSPGPNNAPELPDGATLGVERTTTVVDLDQLFNTLDERTRRGLQDVIQGGATQYAGKEREVSEAAKYFSPAISTTTRLVREMSRDDRLLEDAIVSTARVMSAVSERRTELTQMVGSLNTMFGAIASQNQNFSTALGEAPGTLREANTTFRDLRAALDDLDPLVEASYPATRDLDRFFREFRPLVNEAVPTFEDLSKLVNTPGPGNDATDLVRMQPALQRIGSPTFKNSVEAMRMGQPVLDFLRPYTPELVGWIQSTGQATANYDANGHYARVMEIVNAFTLTDSPAGPVLKALPPAERQVGLQSGQIKRCPGSATQRAEDGSNPYTPEGSDCDPSIVPPGP